MPVAFSAGLSRHNEVKADSSRQNAVETGAWAKADSSTQKRKRIRAKNITLVISDPISDPFHPFHVRGAARELRTISLVAKTLAYIMAMFEPPDRTWPCSKANWYQ